MASKHHKTFQVTISSGVMSASVMSFASEWLAIAVAVGIIANLLWIWEDDIERIIERFLN
jgi:hypothetical protein